MSGWIPYPVTGTGGGCDCFQNLESTKMRGRTTNFGGKGNKVAAERGLLVKSLGNGGR